MARSKLDGGSMGKNPLMLWDLKSPWWSDSESPKTLASGRWGHGS